MKFFYIGGMFRSGTTLLARMLNSHPNIVCASDPCLPLFKYFRSSLFKELGVDVPPNAPLADYYFNGKYSQYLSLLETISLDFSIPSEWQKNIIQDIINYGKPFSPLIMPYLSRICPSNFRNFLLDILELIYEIYGKNKNCFLVGFKEVWGDEFIGPLYNSFSNMKFIVIIRDPRAVASSKNVADDKYPWLFLGRQWRKLAGLSWNWRQKYPNQVLLIYYEKLISSPKEEIVKILSHLEIDFHEDVLDFSKYKDGYGEPWLQNTSYGQGKASFNPASINKWKEILNDQEKKFIEALCGPEMFLHKYLPSFYEPINRLSSYLRKPVLVDKNSLASWIKDYFVDDLSYYVAELSKEFLRKSLLENENDIDPEHKDELIKMSFLSSRIYNYLIAN